MYGMYYYLVCKKVLFHLEYLQWTFHCNIYLGMMCCSIRAL